MKNKLKTKIAKQKKSIPDRSYNYTTLIQPTVSLYIVVSNNKNSVGKPFFLFVELLNFANFFTLSWTIKIQTISLSHYTETFVQSE